MQSHGNNKLRAPPSRDREQMEKPRDKLDAIFQPPQPYPQLSATDDANGDIESDYFAEPSAKHQHFDPMDLTPPPFEPNVDHHEDEGGQVAEPPTKRRRINSVHHEVSQAEHSGPGIARLHSSPGVKESDEDAQNDYAPKNTPITHSQDSSIRVPCTGLKKLDPKIVANVEELRGLFYRVSQRKIANREKHRQVLVQACQAAINQGLVPGVPKGQDIREIRTISPEVIVAARREQRLWRKEGGDC